MKKIIVTIVILAILLCFTGCNKNATSSADEGCSSAESEHTKLDDVLESSIVQHNSEPQSSSQISSNNTTKTETKTLIATNGDEITISLTTGNKPEITVSVNDEEIFNYKDFKDYADQYNFENDFDFEVVNEYSEGYINWAYQFKWGIVLSTATGDTKNSYWVSVKHQYEDNIYRQEGLGTLVEKWGLLELNDAGKYWNSEKLAEAIVEDIYKTTDYTLAEVANLFESGYENEKYERMRSNQLSPSSQFQKIYEVSVKNEVVALLCVDAATYFLEIQELNWEHPEAITWENTDNKIVYSCVEN